MAGISAVPGAVIPGAMMPGRASLVQTTGSVLAAIPRLAALATEGPDLNTLWATYQAAQQTASRAWENHHMMRQAGGTDGTAGFLYGKAYAAQTIADQARSAWEAANARAYPGARG